MSAPRRDSSQSPDPTSGHGMGSAAKNGGDMVPNGPILQPGEYDQWRTHSVYSHNGGFGPLTSTQPAPIPSDYMTNYYTASPYTMNDHHGGWTTAPAAGYYHPQGLSPPVTNQYMEHMTLFGGGPAPGSNSFFYNYFSTAPTNGSDYNAWGGPSIIPTPRSAISGGGAGSKHSEFYYPMMDGGGYTHYIGTDIVGGNTNGDNRLNVGQAQQQSTNSQFGYLEQGVNRMSVYDDVIPGAIGRTSQGVGSGPYGGNGAVGASIVGHQGGGGGVPGATMTNSSGSDSKKKSWATIASLPAKPNSGGSIGGPLAGIGKGKGRVPIGGVPGSASVDSGSGEPGGGFWPPPVQSSPAPAAPAKQENSTPAVATGNHSQRSYGGGLVRNASSGGGSSGIWSSTNASSGMAAKNSSVNSDATQPVSPPTAAVNGGGNSDSENGEYNNNEVEKDVNSVDTKTTTNNSSSTVDKSDSQKAPPPQRNFFDRSTLENDYNPKEFTMPTKGVRYFVIKSYSEDDIHRSIKYGIWCSTDHGNKRLDGAYREREGKGPIYLLFSVNGSGHFCGVAQMTSPLDYSKSSGVWAQDKWKGQFTVKWIYVKDVPNAQLRHIRLENNENKPVTNSRDTQEVPPEKGRQVLKIIHQYRHTTSLFDDFGHYEKRQEEEDQRKGRRPAVGEE